MLFGKPESSHRVSQLCVAMAEFLFVFVMGMCSGCERLWGVFGWQSTVGNAAPSRKL